MGVLLLALAAALFATRDLYACSCIGSPQPCEAVWNTRYVFTGTVTAMRREGNLRAVTFRVERTWRHDMPGRSLPAISDGLAPGCYSIGTNLPGYHRGGARAQPSILRDDIEVGPGQRVSIGVVRRAP
jgi:hypothetical protein